MVTPFALSLALCSFPLATPCGVGVRVFALFFNGDEKTAVVSAEYSDHFIVYWEDAPDFCQQTGQVERCNVAKNRVWDMSRNNCATLEDPSATASFGPLATLPPSGGEGGGGAGGVIGLVVVACVLLLACFVGVQMRMNKDSMVEKYRAELNVDKDVEAPVEMNSMSERKERRTSHASVSSQVPTGRQSRRSSADQREIREAVEKALHKQERRGSHSHSHSQHSSRRPSHSAGAGKERRRSLESAHLPASKGGSRRASLDVTRQSRRGSLQ